jgi:hypothetical protein
MVADARSKPAALSGYSRGAAKSSMPIHERRLAGRCCIISVSAPPSALCDASPLAAKIICSLAPMPAAAAPIAYERTTGAPISSLTPLSLTMVATAREQDVAA